MFDFFAFPILTTGRLCLRELTHDDAEAMAAIFGVPDMYRFLNDPPIDTREKAIELIDWFAGKYQAHGLVTWAITLRREGALIGMGNAYDWNREDRRVDIGYHITAPLWGQGFATEAARAIITWCFDHLDVHRIQADCTDGNIASERVMLKCNFKLEGVWREKCWEHGRFVDIKQFGLLRSEWPDRA